MAEQAFENFGGDRLPLEKIIRDLDNFIDEGFFDGGSAAYEMIDSVAKSDEEYRVALEGLYIIHEALCGSKTADWPALSLVRPLTPRTDQPESVAKPAFEGGVTDSSGINKAETTEHFQIVRHLEREKQISALAVQGLGSVVASSLEAPAVPVAEPAKAKKINVERPTAKVAQAEPLDVQIDRPSETPSNPSGEAEISAPEPTISEAEKAVYELAGKYKPDIKLDFELDLSKTIRAFLNGEERDLTDDERDETRNVLIGLYARYLRDSSALEAAGIKPVGAKILSKMIVFPPRQGEKPQSIGVVVSKDPSIELKLNGYGIGRREAVASSLTYAFERAEGDIAQVEARPAHRVSPAPETADVLAPEVVEDDPIQADRKRIVKKLFGNKKRQAVALLRHLEAEKYEASDDLTEALEFLQRKTKNFSPATDVLKPAHLSILKRLCLPNPKTGFPLTGPQLGKEYDDGLKRPENVGKNAPKYDVAVNNTLELTTRL